MKIFKVTNLSLLLFFTLICNTISAQDYAVTPLTEFSRNYKDQHTVISKELENNSDISFAEKLSIYEKKIAALKEDFKSKRQSEYSAKTVKRAKRNKCTGLNTRGITDCESVYILAPNKNMYTQKEWIKLESTNKGAKVEVKDDSSINFKVTASGKRINKATVYATFKYKPEIIPLLVEKETTDLFNQIAND